MVTDWTANPDVVLLFPVFSALFCALVLALTRGILPPGNPWWRLARAIFIVVVLGVAAHIAAIVAPHLMSVLLMDNDILFSRGIVYLLASALGGCLLIGWLIPWLIEGRTLTEMGWRRRGWMKYLLLGTVAGLILAALFHPPPHGHELLTELRYDPTVNLGLLFTLPLHFILSCALLGVFTAWREENIFRGHLLPALREVGLRGGPANLMQALAFTVYHPAFLILLMTAVRQPTTDTVGHAIGGMGVLFGWGILFGVIRIRTHSIIQSFAFHGSFDALRFMLAFGPMAAMMHSLTAQL